MIDLKELNHVPNLDEISEFIGIPLFDEFYRDINDKYKPICKIEYSKDVWLRGWNVKFRKGIKPLCVLYPKERYFTVLIVIGSSEKETVENLLPKLSNLTQEIYYKTKEGNGQKWLMINLDAKNDTYQDVLRLIHIRWENRKSKTTKA